MKTLRQWRKLWDAYYNKTMKWDAGENEKRKKSHHPQTLAFISARKLLRTYVAEDNLYSTYEWPSWVNSLVRFFQGNVNRHHADKIKGILYYRDHEADKYLFPISTDNYDEILNQKNTPYEKREFQLGTMGGHVGYNKEFMITDEEWESITALRKSGNYSYQEEAWINPQGKTEEKHTIFRNGKNYLIKNPFKSEKEWGFYVDAIFYRYQVYDLLDEIQKKFSDTPIHRNGDFAKILKVIEENTGHSISVKYGDYGLDHFRAMGKGFLDTFKPYKYSKSDYYLKRALKQPLYGIDNFVRGIVSIIGSPFVFMRNMLSVLFYSRSHDGSWEGLFENLSDNAQLTVTEPMFYIFDGLCLLTRGLLQIVTTPFSYISLLFRKPENVEQVETKIKNSPRIQNLFAKLKNSTEENKALNHALLVSTIHRKYLKGVGRGEQTSLQNEHSLFMKTNYPQKTLINSIDPTQEAEEDYLQQFDRASI